MQLDCGEYSKPCLEGQKQQSGPVSRPNPAMCDPHKTIVKKLVEYLQGVDTKSVMKFIGEQEAIRQLANPDVKSKNQGLIHNGGLLMPQERHNLKWDPTEVIPGHCSLFNPSTILVGSQEAWLDDTVRVCRKTWLSRERKPEISDVDDHHMEELMQAMDYVQDINTKKEESEIESENTDVRV